MQEGEIAALPQCCNMCWNGANGACFRTSCGHLFCESCAFQHFGQSQACAACGTILQEADINELTLGLPQNHFGKMMFQAREKEIYKEPDFGSMLQSLARATMLLNESTRFVMGQVIINLQRSTERISGQEVETVKLRHEQGRMRREISNQATASEQKQSELQHKIRLREKEMEDLQEAYKEKSRKCGAWEKAYRSLKAQIDGGSGAGAGRGGGLTPPESPRIGAMRGGPPTFMSQDISPRGGGGHGSSRGAMPRPADRARITSPHSGSRAYMGRDGGGGGGGDGSRSSWPMPRRPTTSRGGGGGGGAGGGGSGGPGYHVSPMLRPRQAQGYSVTPSPTYTAQQAHALPQMAGHFNAKRPETPKELREYYPHRNPSPSSRPGGVGGGGAGGGSGCVGGARGGGPFVGNKHGLF